MTVDQAAIIALVAVLVGLEACGGSGTHAQRALDGVRAPAERDDAEAQESLGLRALAEQGHDLAQFNLGSMYLTVHSCHSTKSFGFPPNLNFDGSGGATCSRSAISSSIGSRHIEKQCRRRTPCLGPACPCSATRASRR